VHVYVYGYLYAVCASWFALVCVHFLYASFMSAGLLLLDVNLL